MRLSFFKNTLLLVALCMSQFVYGSNVEDFFNDTTDVVVASVTPKKYDMRIHKYRTGWGALIPTHSKLQYAGNMGFLSLGFGWDYGKRGQWETDLLLGYLPKFDGDDWHLTTTIKENYIPWSFSLKKNKSFIIEPLECGLYINTVYGEEFWAKQPKKYPSGYYDIAPKVRLNFFYGERFTYKIPEQKRTWLKAVTWFYEISTHDIGIISAVHNEYIQLDDIIALSLGLKFPIF